MRLYLTADLEQPSRGDHASRASRQITSSHAAKAAATHAGNGRGKPDRADEAKWRDALGDPGSQTPVQGAVAAGVQPHKAHRGRDTDDSTRSAGAAAVGGQVSALASHKAAATAVSDGKDSAAVGAVSAKAESSDLTKIAPPASVARAADSRWPTTTVPLPEQSVPEVVGKRADPVVAQDASDPAADRVSEPAGGSADRRNTGRTAAAAAVVVAADPGLQTSEVAPTKQPALAPQVPDTGSAVESGDAVVWRRTAVTAQPDGVQPEGALAGDPEQNTAHDRSHAKSPAPTGPARGPIPGQAAEPLAKVAADPLAPAAPLPDREAQAPAPRSPPQTGLGESLFRLRALAEPAASLAQTEPAESPRVSVAPIAVGQSVPSADEPADAEQTVNTAAIAPEEPGASGPADPRKLPLPAVAAAAPDAEPKPVTSPGPGSPQRADLSGHNAPALAEPVGRLPVLRLALTPDPAEGAVGQALQAAVPLSGGAGAALPLIADAGPVAPLSTRDLTQQVVRALPGATGQEVTVVLSPEELGAVRMVLLAKGETLILQIHADRAETLELMRRSADQLMQDLRSSGFTQVTLDFGQNRRHPAPPPQPAPVAQPYASGQQAPALTDTPAPVRRLAAGGLDLRL